MCTHGSATAFAVPVILFDKYGRMYTLIESLYVANEATRCGTLVRSGMATYKKRLYSYLRHLGMTAPKYNCKGVHV